MPCAFSPSHQSHTQGDCRRRPTTPGYPPMNQGYQNKVKPQEFQNTDNKDVHNVRSDENMKEKLENLRLVLNSIIEWDSYPLAAAHVSGSKSVNNKESTVLLSNLNKSNNSVHSNRENLISNSMPNNSRLTKDLKSIKKDLKYIKKRTSFNKTQKGETFTSFDQIRHETNVHSLNIPLPYVSYKEKCLNFLNYPNTDYSVETEHFYPKTDPYNISYENGKENVY